MNPPLNPPVPSSVPVVPLSIRPVVHADGHPGSSEVAGCTLSLYWVLRHSVCTCVHLLSPCLFRAHARSLSLSAMCRLWECALQQEWCDFWRNLFWAKFKMRFSIAVKISFYFRQKSQFRRSLFFRREIFNSRNNLILLSPKNLNFDAAFFRRNLNDIFMKKINA